MSRLILLVVTRVARMPEKTMTNSMDAGGGGYFVATIEPAAAVFQSMYAHFLGPESHNLVVR